MSVGANFYRNTIFNGETNNIGFTKSTGWYGIGKPSHDGCAKIQYP